MKTLFKWSCFAVVACASVSAFAEDAAPASPHTFSSNVALTSNYVFRGMTQTFGKPAIQGGFDYSHASGVYVGTWASSVSPTQYNNGAGMEWDIYGGFKKSFGDFTGDLGVLAYVYPGAKIVAADGATTKYDTTEIYGALSYKMFTLKYSHAVSNKFFGLPDADGSGYVDLSANFDLGSDFTLVTHLGHQNIHHYSDLNYSDYKIGITKLYNGFTFGLALTGTNADSNLYTISDGSGKTKDISKTVVAFSLSRSF